MSEQEQDPGRVIGEQPEGAEPVNEEPEAGGEGLTDEELNEQRRGEGEEA